MKSTCDGDDRDDWVFVSQLSATAESGVLRQKQADNKTDHVVQSIGENAKDKEGNDVVDENCQHSVPRFDPDLPPYYPENDPLAQKKIEQWQDLKFGLLMHWGTYCQWGVVESWSICSEDETWITRDNPNYIEYKSDYEKLKHTFNPVNFEPTKWAKAAKNAGMRYVVFTTKHHDGFCMFNTKLTDYKITDEDCPFSSDKRCNVTKHVFDAFREEGLWTGAYFSKPDWHSESYWSRNFATPDRGANYDIKSHPKKWESFVQYTHKQILELMTEYGKVDILWLDGDWVRPMTEEEIREESNSIENRRSNRRFQSQDIRMDEVKQNIREKQPGIIVVDRNVAGPNQNYLTPENTVPEKAITNAPWESCIIAGGGWSWREQETYMSGRQAVHMLVDIVSKGGNLLLNIAPGPEGSWKEEAFELLNDIGDWMRVNGEAIYGTRPLRPYREGKTCLTRREATRVTYLIILAAKDETTPPPNIFMSEWSPQNGASINLLGSEGLLGPLKWERNEEGGFVVHVPKNIRDRASSIKYAWVLKVNPN